MPQLNAMDTLLVGAVQEGHTEGNADGGLVGSFQVLPKESVFVGGLKSLP